MGYNPNHGEGVGHAIALIKELSGNHGWVPVISSIDGNPLTFDKTGRIVGYCTLYSCYKVFDFLNYQFNPWTETPFAPHHITNKKVETLQVPGYVDA